ncbi:MAG: hypothetical protein K1X94_33915 [Sandaracinaceae bacterium]|nr:hypothetical protein [Sandaracinaceae bacterium]
MKANRPSIGFVIVLAVFSAAPTVGDVGGCNESATNLDARKFFSARLSVECSRCKECDFITAACKRACDKNTIIPSTFPAGCQPLEHDGQVCLRALEALSCSAFEDAVATSPIVPTECDFCPEPSEAGP